MEDWGSCRVSLAAWLLPLRLPRWLLMTPSSWITRLRSSWSLSTAPLTSPRSPWRELASGDSLGKPSLVWKLAWDRLTEGKQVLAGEENATWLLLGVWAGFSVAESELSWSLGYSLSSEDAVPLGAKGWRTLAASSLYVKGADDDCGRGWIKKEGLVKTRGKWWADFSGWAESGDDTDKAEKEDVTSEAVETKIEGRERDLYNIQARVMATIIVSCKHLSGRSQYKPVWILKV